MENKIQNKIVIDEWTSTVLEVKNISSPGITLKIINNEIDFYSLKDNWNQIVMNSSATIFQTFEWLYYWWKYFVSSHQYTLHIILIYTGDNLIGIAPCFIQSFAMLGFDIFKQLKLLGCGLNSGKSSSNPIEQKGISDYLDIICKNGFENAVASTFVSYINDFKFFFDKIDFQNIPGDSFIYNWILPLLKGTGYETVRLKSDLCPKLKVPNSMDSYLEMVKSNTRRKLRQVVKQMESDSGSKIEEVQLQNYTSAFQNLKMLHQKRWNELGYLGLFSDGRFEKFQNEISRLFMENGWLWFKTLKLNDKIIAVRLGFKFKNEMYDYLSGFDVTPLSASIRPGMVLLILMIKDAIENEFHYVDFLRGAEDYKFEISSLVTYNYKLIIRNKDSSSVIRLMIYRMIMLQNSIMHRLRSEKSIIDIHIKQHGPISFVPAYLKFYIGRLRLFFPRILKNQKQGEPKPKASEALIAKSNRAKSICKVKLQNISKPGIHESEIKA